ncbi:MAG: outer membrane lipoprotein-sorting protein [Verrucomicrobiia bacterium]|jgi:hypothetical protein
MNLPRLSLLAFAALIYLALPTPDSRAAALSTADIEGRKLVQRIRDMRPARDFANTGIMKIDRPRGGNYRVPVYLRTIAGPQSWQNLYGTTTSPTLMIVQSHEFPNEYRTLPPQGVKDAVNFGSTRLIRNPMVPFAGSDFWLFDLGLGFFHWPNQRLHGTEYRRTQKCYKLESFNPTPSRGYSRVVSWVDQDTLGIVLAEAYDPQGKLMKIFKPKKFYKDKGRWQLKEMEMRDERTDSVTTLIFDKPVE